ncbi:MULTISPECIES: BTAD domain-containing putative transcriptional regulator [unclassified Kribbella]|uniref:BTAD domain-containing putative transcriptional regulator n=1 Tax=unclassified Kribbella TaxID=2644121 RepID=UPI0033C18795
MDYQVLGHLRVLDENGAEVQLSAPKLRTLLALLLVHRGHPVSVDRIAQALWGDLLPSSAANLVQGYIRDLRLRLGAEEVATVPGGYRLDVRWGTVDAERFEDLVRARRYEEALALWHGTALEEWVEQPWARAHAARLEEMRLSAAEERLAQEVDAGQASAVVAELAALVQEHPLRERFRVLMVKALYASGRQADALAAYAQARRDLADEVGLEPGPELRAVEAAVLAQDSSLVPAPIRSAAAPPAPVTALVGRDSELASIRSALAVSRLVTLSGPGGIGKTRLAVEVAAAPPESGPVWFVELAPVLVSDAVARSVARALQLAESPGQEIDLIGDYVSRRPGLLVLDTCEHVVEAVARLATRVLSRCPDLKILATTRQPLRAPGEQVVQLSGLDEVAGADVFTARARAANPAVELDPDRVRAIVGRLEGVPLALELAAARIASLSLEQLADSLSQPLDALAGDALAGDPRHRTMRAVIGWSHNLLDERDREAFAALSVFLGSFDREAAGAVVDDGPDAVDHLLGRSLLTRDVDLLGQARYRFLGPVRQFAEETATPTMRDNALHQHLDYHVALAARVNDRIQTQEATAWAAVARASAEDLRKAATYAISERLASAGRLVADLYWPWFLDGQLSELRSWASAVLTGDTDAHVRARLLRILASTALAQGDTAVAVGYAARQLDAAMALRDLELVALARNLLGMAAWARGDYAAAGGHHLAAMDEARNCGRPWTLALVTALAGRSVHATGDREAGEELLRDAEAQAEKVGEPMVLGSALDYRAHAEFALGRDREATRLASRSLAAYRSIGYQEGIASAGTLAAQLAVLAGDYEQAETLLIQALDVSRRLRHLGGTASVLEAMAVLDYDRGEHQRAGRYLDDARALRDQTGTVPSPALHDQLSRVQQSLALER